MRFLAIAFSIIVASSASWAALPSKLARIFTGEMIGARAQFLESITGPAMHAYPYGGAETRDYRVDGCRVTAKVKGGNVTALGLDLTPRCNLDLGAFLGNGYGTTAGLTVGKFANGSFGSNFVQAHSSCIYLCGNAADPVVSFTWDGPHAVNYTTVVLNVILATPVTLAAEQRWEQTMTRAEGHAFIEQTSFNCVRKYDAVAIREFAAAPVNSIMLGGPDLTTDTFGAANCRK